MQGKKVHFKSFGCQMNKLDTALVTSALKEAGFGLIGSVKEADVVLFNTCSVRDHAEQRVFSHLGHLKHIKESREDLVVGVVGCMAQRLGAELLNYGVVDIVCGPTQIPQIPELLTKALEQKSKTLAVTKKIRRPSPNGQAQALDQFESVFDGDDKQIPNQAFVRVMRGCNKFCTYCVVPYVRGPEVSRPSAGIVEQIKRLAAQGVKQVTLLGQTINSYWYTAGEKTYCLADLLEQAADVAGIEWIKFVTSYPSQKFFDRILQAMADLPKVCGYLHMPVQSGSDRILKAMNRRHAAGRYLEMLDKARAIVPDIALSGDFIVGFPGETEADFEATVELVKQARYKNCFVFRYSPRPGTSAEGRLADDVPPKVKKRRNTELLAVQQQISDELSKAFLNRTLKVLVEGPSKKPHLNAAESAGRPQLIGRTAGEWIVVFNGPPNLAGNFANVKIAKTMPLTLFGQLCG